MKMIVLFLIASMSCLAADSYTNFSSEFGVFESGTNEQYSVYMTAGKDWSPPYVFDTTDSVSRTNYFNMSWTCNGEHLVTMILSTNLFTNWTTIEDSRPVVVPLDIEKYSKSMGVVMVEAVFRTYRIRQVGTVTTNRVLNVISEGKTNPVVLKVMGRDEWPSLKRDLYVP